MSEAELKQRIREIIEEVGEVDEVPNAAPFKELGIDSMMAIEIVSEIEREFKINVPEEELAGLTNLDRVFELVQKKTAAAA